MKVPQTWKCFMQYLTCFMGCMCMWHHLFETTYWPHQYDTISAQKTVLLKSHCLTNLIFKKVWSNEASSPKSTPNSDTWWMHLLFDNHMWVLRTPNVTILATNKAIEMKMFSSLRIIVLEKSAFTC